MPTVANFNFVHFAIRNSTSSFLSVRLFWFRAYHLPLNRIICFLRFFACCWMMSCGFFFSVDFETKSVCHSPGVAFWLTSSIIFVQNDDKCNNELRTLKKLICCHLSVCQSAHPPYFDCFSLFLLSFWMPFKRQFEIAFATAWLTRRWFLGFRRNSPWKQWNYQRNIYIYTKSLCL